MNSFDQRCLRGVLDFAPLCNNQHLSGSRYGIFKYICPCLSCMLSMSVSFCICYIKIYNWPLNNCGSDVKGTQ